MISRPWPPSGLAARDPEIFDDGMPELLRRLTPDEKRTLLKMAGVTDDRVPEAEVRRRLGLDR